MWKLSNPPPLLCATLMASLDVSRKDHLRERKRIIPDSRMSARVSRESSNMYSPLFLELNAVPGLQSDIDGGDLPEAVPPDWLSGSPAQDELFEALCQSLSAK